MASQEPNLLAHTLLARIFWYQSGLTGTKSQGDSAPVETAQELVTKAIENHVKAIDLGSTESMYTLGRWLLEDTHKSSEDPALSPRKNEKKRCRYYSRPVD